MKANLRPRQRALESLQKVEFEVCSVAECDCEGERCGRGTAIEEHCDDKGGDVGCGNGGDGK